MELLIATSLIGVLLTVSAVSFEQMTYTQSVSSAAEQIAYAVKKARTYARSQGKITTVSFIEGSSNYKITVGETELTNNNNFDATSGTLPNDIKIMYNGCYDLNFDVDGSLVDSYGNLVNYDCMIDIGSYSAGYKSLTVKGGAGNVTF